MRTKETAIEHHNRNILGGFYLPQKNKLSMIILSRGFNGGSDDFSEYAEILYENGIGEDAS